MVTVLWASELDSEANHRAACKLLCEKLGWDADRFFGGAMDDGHGFKYGHNGCSDRQGGRCSDEAWQQQCSDESDEEYDDRMEGD
jgi:hypothetical protein